MNWFAKCLKQYVDFKGRARRKEFWWFVLINWAISLMIKVVLLKAFNLETERIGSGLYSLALLPPMLSVAARRLHDIGKSAWLMLIPIYNLYLFAQEGETGRNAYGPSPKGLG